MKFDIVKKATTAFHKTGFKVKQHSPEILATVGVVSVVGSVVMACRATIKAQDILEETKHDLEAVHICMEEKAEIYTEEDRKKDLSVIYAQSGIKLVKTYAPAVALLGLGLGCMLKSNDILRKRNVALAAAYATIEKGFKEYRERVVERFGEDIDRELKYNVKAKKVTETEVDPETGEEKKVKKIKNYVNPDDVSGYARFFEEYTRDAYGNIIKNPDWKDDNARNLMFIKAQQSYANDLLRVRGRVTLNEVYRLLNLPESEAGQVVGWVYDEKNPRGDNYIDFGLYSSSQNYSDFIYSNNGSEAILLDFNVDGNILDTYSSRI